MDTNKLNRWLTLAANLGVLAGLIVLIVEIRQSSAIAEAQFYLDQVEANETLEFTMLGDNPAAVWERSVFEPESLSPGDIRVMDAYLSSRLYVWWNMFELEQRGFVKRGATGANIRGSVEFYFGSAFAQNWWQHERDYGDWGDSLTQLIEAAMLKTDSSANQNRIIKLQQASQE